MLRSFSGFSRRPLAGLFPAAAGLVVVLAALLGADGSTAYPLDGESRSGIRRLEGYRLAQARPTGAKLLPGALLGVDDVRLRLAGIDVPEFDSLPEDPALDAALEAVFAGRDPSYALVVVDFSDPENLRWAGLRPDTRQNVGSVGKLLTMAALFHALAGAFPDPADRARVLATTVVRGGDWVLGDEHTVPRFDAEAGVNRFSRLQPGDEMRLSEWLDHAISASANAAGSVVWREAMLIRRFGADYPLSWEDSEAFFNTTPKAELAELARSVSTEPLAAAGIDTEAMRQGSFWTRSAQARVPGITSFATPRQLARLMLRIEQGRLVDEWSSLEMKRYLYITKRRYRYVYAPELGDSAAFFKSGSLYSCREEPGFTCRRYMGNGRNFMNSVATIEYPAAAEAPDTAYTVALISNVLRYNSAWDHSRFAAAIHEAVRTRQAPAVREDPGAGEIAEVTLSD